ncbi:MAG TPA: hypothetical protein VI306_24155 [Pyrinomonadaceae bacterium]
MKQRSLKLLRFLPRLSVAAILGVCLLSGLVPSVIVASTFGIDTGKACCRGQSAGHCKLQVKIKVKTEQMCGLKQTANDDVTIVADEADTSNTSSPGMAAVGNNCASECSSCAARTSQHIKPFKRTPIVRALPLVARPQTNDATAEFVALPATDLEVFSPRGPPHSLR